MTLALAAGTPSAAPTITAAVTTSLLKSLLTCIISPNEQRLKCHNQCGRVIGSAQQVISGNISTPVPLCHGKCRAGRWNSTDVRFGSKTDIRHKASQLTPG